ncbi:MAG: AAA family ATPase [Chloroflexota bacterium]
MSKTTPTLYVTFGLPGAGKTYAARLFEQFGFTMHDGDDDLPDRMIEAINTQQPINDEMRDEFFNRIIAHVHQLLPKHPKLVVAQTFIKEKYRKRFLEHFPDAQFVLVEANDPIRELRLERRTNQPLEPDYTRKMIAMFETPHIPYQVIVNDADGTLQLDDQIAALVKNTVEPPSRQGRQD